MATIARIIVTKKECSPVKHNRNDKTKTNYIPDAQKVSELFDQFLTTAKQNGYRYKFVLFPAGILHFPFPADLTDGDDSITIQRKYIRAATHTFRQWLGNRTEILKSVAKHLLIGIDSVGNDKKNVQLIAVYRTSTGKIHWTGKSYPVSREINKLIDMDIESHFVNLGGKRTAVFCCHDLMICSPRGQANLRKGSKKEKQAKKFRRELKRFQPEIILHLPHVTNKKMTWRQSWKHIEETLPVKHYASGITYIKSKKSDPIESVLAKTKLGEVVNFVCGKRIDVN